MFSHCGYPEFFFMGKLKKLTQLQKLFEMEMLSANLIL